MVCALIMPSGENIRSQAGSVQIREEQLCIEWTQKKQSSILHQESEVIYKRNAFLCTEDISPLQTTVFNGKKLAHCVKGDLLDTPNAFQRSKKFSILRMRINSYSTFASPTSVHQLPVLKAENVVRIIRYIGFSYS